MNAQDIVSNVSQKLGLDQAASEKAVGMIFSVIAHEAEGTSVAEFFASIPGAMDLAKRYDVMTAGTNDNAPSGGLLGTLSSVLGSSLGEKASALIAGISQLRSSGLDAAQIRQAGTTLVSQAEAAAGPELVNEVISSVPGLRGHLGV